MERFLKNNGTVIALILLVMLMTIIEPSFFTPRNMSNLIRQVSVVGIIAVGMTFVILIAGIDLSVGSIVGLSAVVVALLMQAGFPVWLAIILTVLSVGVITGLFTGFMTAKFNIHPFIITLGVTTIARGLSLILTNGVSVPVTNDFFGRIGAGYISPLPSLLILIIAAVIGTIMVFRRRKQKQKYNIKTTTREFVGTLILILLTFVVCGYIFLQYRGIPFPVAIFLAVALWGIFVLGKTRFGRRLYAIGGNEDVAWLSGIDIFKSKIEVYTIVAVLSSISGIILASRLNGASPNLGNGFELDAIASVIIGGTSFMGGIGTVSGTIIGALIIGVIDNGMSIKGINTFFQMIVKGIIIILAVLLDVINRRQRTK